MSDIECEYDFLQLPSESDKKASEDFKTKLEEQKESKLQKENTSQNVDRSLSEETKKQEKASFYDPLSDLQSSMFDSSQLQRSTIIK